MIHMLKTYIDHYRYDEEGATAVEYGIMVVLIAVAIIATVTLVGTQLDSVFEQVRAALAGE